MTSAPNPNVRRIVIADDEEMIRDLVLIALGGSDTVEVFATAALSIATGRHEEAADLVRRALDVPGGLSGRERVISLGALGATLARRGEFGASFDLLEEILPALPEVGLGRFVPIAHATQSVCALPTGRGDPVRLVELGPGRGTLMHDALRAARVMPGFTAAARIHLVETSLALRAKQARTLADLPTVTWHDLLADVPDGPTLAVANEFFDALPVRQFQRTEAGWRERLIDADAETGELGFVLSDRPDAAIDRVPGAAAEVGEPDRAPAHRTRPHGEVLCQGHVEIPAEHDRAEVADPTGERLDVRSPRLVPLLPEHLEQGTCRLGAALQ